MNNLNLERKVLDSLEEGRTQILFIDPNFHLNTDGLREGLMVLKSEDINPRDLKVEDWKTVERAINLDMRDAEVDDCDFYVIAISGPDDDDRGLSFWKGAINEMNFAKQSDLTTTWEQMLPMMEVDAQGNHFAPIEKSELALAMMATKNGEVH